MLNFRRFHSKLAMILVLAGGLTQAAQARTWTEGTTERPALILDGRFAGYLKGAEGGDATTLPGGGVSYSDISLVCRPDSSLASWISASLAGKGSSSTGAIVMIKENSETSRLTFTDGSITEVTIPALDASSREAAYLTVKIHPSSTVFTVGKPTRVTLPAASKQRVWMGSNFKMSINGVDCTRVKRIEAITLRPVGGSGATVVSGVSYSCAQKAGESLLAWQQSSIKNGGNIAANQRDGQIQLLEQNLKTSVLTVSLGGLGLVSVAPLPGSIPSLKATLSGVTGTITFP